RVRDLCREGYQSYDAADYEQALRRFYTAWTLLPKPQAEFEQAGWVLTAIGDSYYRKREWQHGIEALSSALHCRGAAGNPFIHLRLGQCMRVAGDRKKAQEDYLLATEHGGRDWMIQNAPELLAQLEAES